MLSETAVRYARRLIMRELRTQPAGVRAGLPFDAADRDDVDCWSRQSGAEARNERRFAGTDAWVARSLLWAARDELKKAARKVPRDEDGNYVSVYDADAASESEDASEGAHALGRAIDEFAVLAAIAASNIVVRAGPGRRRRIRAVLSCLSRVYMEIHAKVGATEAGSFLDALDREVLFRRLLSVRDREAFANTLRGIAATGNAREDLTRAGRPIAGAAQWREFQEMFVSVRDRDNDGLPTVNRRFTPEEHAQ